MEPKLSDYSVKGVKTFLGMEGYGYNATLYREKKKVATVIDSGDGGETMINWEDRLAKRVELTGRNFSGKEFTYDGTPEEKILIELLAKEPMKKDDDGIMTDGYSETEDMFIGSLVTDYEMKKELRRLCKGNVCYKLKSDPAGTYYARKATYSEKAKAILEQEHGDNLDIIYNERRSIK